PGNQELSDEGWISLFNGENLDGWTATRHTRKGRRIPDEAGWKIEDGALIRDDAISRSLVTTREFRNLELEFDVRLPAGTGIVCGLRIGRAPDALLVVPILDPARLKSVSTEYLDSPFGRQFLELPARLRPPDEWNTVRVRCVGDELTVSVNGHRTTSLRLSAFRSLRKLPSSGPVGFLTRGEAFGVALRNIRAREVEPQSE
ncbi:MAG: DUF1080 domain-containing protein, partial [Planctomycetes bacterium]|nr:DUF1080 domain-containing protein [Planctomycetota bacterium]